MHTAGAAVFTAGNSSNQGNNTGWNFQSCNVCVPPAIPVISGLMSVCANKVLNYATSADTGHTYVWTVSGGTIVSGQGSPAITVSWGAAGTGTLRVLDSINATICKTSSIVYAVNINANPVPHITGPAAVCANASAAYATPSNPGHTFVWALNGGALNTGQGTATINISWGSQGQASVIVTDSANGSGCKVSDTLNIIKNPNPVAGFTINNTSQCLLNNSFTFNDTCSNITSRNWDFGTGAWGAGPKTPITAFANAAAYTIRLKVINNFTCVDSVSRIIQVNPQPVASFGVNSLSQCLHGNSFIFTDNSSIGSGTLNRNWCFGNGDSSTLLNAVKTYGAPANYLVKLVSLSTYGCMDSTSKIVTVKAQPGASISNAKGVNAFCQNDSLLLNANNGPAFIYNWLENGVALPLATQNKLMVKQSASYQVIVTNNLSCTDTSAVFVCSQIALPVVGTITGPSTASSTGPAVAYSITPHASHMYYWSLSGGNIVSGQGTNSVNIQWVLNGARWIKVKLINANNCSDTNQLAVTITTGMQALNEAGHIEVYPNPVDEQFKVSSATVKILAVNIYDVQGSMVQHNEVNAWAGEISMGTLSTGVYMLEIKTEAGLKYFKLLKN